MQKETLDDAFKLLKERLDPPTDIFQATSKFRQMVWPVVELVYDFFSRYLEKGLRAGLSTKKICIFMTTQLPCEVSQQAKDWINSKEADFTEEDGMLLAVKIRETFISKGVPMSQGHRDRATEKVAKN